MTTSLTHKQVQQYGIVYNEEKTADNLDAADEIQYDNNGNIVYNNTISTVINSGDSSVIQSRQYIPLAIAQNKINTLTDQLNVLKTKNLTVIDNIIEKYEKLNLDTKTEYNTILNNIKAKTSVRLNENQQLIESLQSELRLLTERQQVHDTHSQSQQQLQQERDDAVNKHTALEQQHSELLAKHSDTERLLEQKSQQITDSVGKDDYDNLQKQHDMLSEQQHETNAKLLQISTQRDQLQQHITSLYEQLHQYNAVHAETKQDLNTAADELRQTDEQLQYISERVVQYEARLQELQRENELLQSQLASGVRVNVEELMQQRQAKMAEIEQIKQQLQDELQQQSITEQRRTELTTAIEQYNVQLAELAARPAEPTPVVTVIQDPAVQQRVRWLETELNKANKQSYKLQKQLYAVSGSDNTSAESQNIQNGIVTVQQQLDTVVPIYQQHVDTYKHNESIKQQYEQQLHINTTTPDIQHLIAVFDTDTQLLQQRQALAARVSQLKNDKATLTDMKSRMMSLKEQIQQQRDAGNEQEAVELEQQYNDMKQQAQQLANELKVNYAEHEINLAQFKHAESEHAQSLQQYDLGSVDGDKARKLSSAEHESLHQYIQLYQQRDTDKQELKAQSEQIEQYNTHLKQLQQSLKQVQNNPNASRVNNIDVQPYQPVEPFIFTNITHLSTSDQYLQQQYDTLQHSVAERDVIITTLQQQLEHLQANAAANNQEQQQQIALLQQHIQFLQLNNPDARFNSITQQLNNERVVYNTTLQQHHTTEQQLQQQIIDLQAQLTAKQNIITKLQADATAMKATLHVTGAFNATHSNLPIGTLRPSYTADAMNELADGQNAKQLRQQLHSIQQYCSELEEEIDVIQHDIQNKQKEIDQVNRQLAASAENESEQTADITAQINKKQAELSVEQNKVVELKSQMQALKDQKTALETSVAQAQQTLVELENSHASAADTMVNELKQRYEQLTQQHVQDHEQAILSIQMQIQQLQTELDNDKAKTQQLTEQLASESTTINQLESEIQHHTVEEEKLSDLAGNAQVKIDALNDTITYNEDMISQHTTTLQSLNNNIDNLSAAMQEAERRFKEEQKRRKEFQLKYEDAKGKIRVYSRVRPFSKQEIANKESTLLRPGINEWTLELNETETDLMGNVKDKWREYIFDHVFQYGLEGSKGNATQIDVFNECVDFADLSSNGINTCIFAYGQSGTGKTFTMAGIKPSPENPTDTSLLGLKPRMIEYVYKLADENRLTHEYKISCYLVEIYLNTLEDVLFKWNTQRTYKNKPKKEWPAPPELKVRVDANKRVSIENVVIMEFGSAAEMTQAMDECEELRRTRRTGLNEASSRSHLVFTMLIQSTERSTGKTVRGKMSLVDLAGSERADKTNVDGLSKQQRDSMMEEGIAINESLRMLKNVFRILGTAHLPVKKGQKPEIVQYRGNMLTELMQDSLGGNAKTLMFVNVGPAASNISETQDSLQYGDYVKNITNEKASADVDHVEQIRVLKAKVAEYEAAHGEMSVSG